MNPPNSNGPYRAALPKQLEMIRAYGIEPRADISMNEASEILERLVNDPSAQSRKEEIECILWDLQEAARRNTPLPKGIAAKARKMISACRDAKNELSALRSVVSMICARAPLSPEDLETLESDFEDRAGELEDVFDCFITDIDYALDRMESESDRAEKRLAGHELAEGIAGSEDEVLLAQSDLATLSAWAKETLGQIEDGTLPTVAPEPKKRARRMLTKEEAGTPAGERLLRFLQEAATDGALDGNEIVELRSILDDPSLGDCPGIASLRTEIDQACADGAVDLVEYRAILDAIRCILPTAHKTAWDNLIHLPDLSERPATDAQLNYILELGGGIRDSWTVRDASEVIDSLRGRDRS